MSFYLFAFNHQAPRGGADDMIGVYPHSTTDAMILDAVAEAIEKGRLQKEERLQVNGFFFQGYSMGINLHWEFRMAASLDDEFLKFAKVKVERVGLGAIGLVPLD